MSAARAAHAVEVSLPQVIGVEPGETFAAYVQVSAVSGLAGYQFTVAFDDFLEPLSVENAGLTTAWSAPAVNLGTTSVSAAAFGTADAAGSGTIAILRFRVKSTAANGAESPLTFSSATLNDGAIPTTLVHGLVTVTRVVFAYLPPQPRAYLDADFDVPLRLDDGTGVLGYVVRIEYDPLLFAYLGAANGALPDAAGWALPVVNAASPGVVVLSGFGPQALAGPGSLLTLTFHVLSGVAPNTTSTIAIASAVLNDGAIQAVTGDAAVLVRDAATLPLAPAAWCALVLLFMIAARCMQPARRRHAPGRAAAPPPGNPSSHGDAP